jgi:hypothetical protein
MKEANTVLIIHVKIFFFFNCFMKVLNVWNFTYKENDKFLYKVMISNKYFVSKSFLLE